jgi:DNA-directed RNA polymerase subunit RPC12/RpoP
MSDTTYLFICAECNMSFDADAEDENDDQPCPECGEMCAPVDPREE